MDYLSLKYLAETVSINCYLEGDPRVRSGSLSSALCFILPSFCVTLTLNRSKRQGVIPRELSGAARRAQTAPIRYGSRRLAAAGPDPAADKPGVVHSELPISVKGRRPALALRHGLVRVSTGISARHGTHDLGGRWTAPEQATSPASTSPSPLTQQAFPALVAVTWLQTGETRRMRGPSGVVIWR
jgi:hypothetical protein